MSDPAGERRPRPTRARHAFVEVVAGPYGLMYLGLVGFCLAATSYRFPAQLPMALAGAVLVLGATFQNKGCVVGGSAGRALLTYGLCIGLSVPTSIWLGRSIEGFQEALKWFVIFLVSVNALTTRKRLVWFLAVLVLMVALFPGVGSLDNYLGGVTKAEGRASWRGLFGNANMVALLAVMHLPLAIALLSLRRSLFWRLIWILVAVLLVAVTVLTKSRAGFIALVVLAAGSLLVNRRRVAVGAAVLATTLGVVLFGPADFRQRVGTIVADENDRDHAAQSRLIIWGVAMDIALSRPITGVGVNTFEMAIAQRAPDELGTAGGQRWVDTHNTYLNIWAEIGTLGIVAFLCALGLLVRESRGAIRRAERGDPLAVILRAGMLSILAFAVMGLFNTFQNTWFFYVIFGVVLAAIRLVNREAAAQSGAVSVVTQQESRFSRQLSTLHRRAQ